MAASDSVSYRKLHQRTINDAYVISRTDDTLHLLAGAKYFSTLDLKSGLDETHHSETHIIKTTEIKQEKMMHENKTDSKDGT